MALTNRSGKRAKRALTARQKSEALRATAAALRGIPVGTISYARDVVRHTSYLVITKGPNGYIVIDRERVKDAARAGYEKVPE